MQKGNFLRILFFLIFQHENNPHKPYRHYAHDENQLAYV